MQLPSNKIGGLFVTVVLLVVLVISANIISDKFGSNDAPELVDADLILQRKTTDNSSIDRDNDGLLDWQESLYGSDPNLMDTDGDGTNDGDEIKEGRDPAIPAPNDALISSSSLINKDFEAKGYAPGTLTDNLSVELFANYISLKGDNNLTAETGGDLIGQISQKADAETSIQNIYSINNLRLVVSDKENLEKYGNNFAIIYLDYLNQIQGLSNLDDDSYVSSVSQRYQIFAKTMSGIEIPDVAANIHVQIINKLHNTGVLIENVHTYRESDPVKSLFAIQGIKQNSEGEYELYSSLANYFKDNDIIFTDNNIVRFWNFYE